MYLESIHGYKNIYNAMLRIPLTFYVFHVKLLIFIFVHYTKFKMLSSAPLTISLYQIVIVSLHFMSNF